MTIRQRTGILVVMSWTFSFATTALAEMDDFNELIQESQKTESELRAKLKLDSGPRIKESEMGTIARDSVEVPTVAEQIAASSSASQMPTLHRRKVVLPDRKAETKRISQELNELN